MAFRDQIPDKTLLKNIDQKLRQKAGGSNRVTATVHGGDVTMAGTIAFEYERRPILRIASAVSGVRRVIDQMRVVPKKKFGM